MNYPEVKSLFSPERIRDRIQELAHQIDTDFEHDHSGKTLVAIGVLKGSFLFYADLVRQLTVPVRCEFLGLSTYEKPAIQSGEVKIILDIEATLEGKDLLIIEDLVDTGLTLRFLQKTLAARNPSSLKTCALLLKKGEGKRSVTPDYVGFEMDNSFAVGYGIDHEGRYRELPYVGTLGVK